MRLLSFTVENFRSITSARKISVEQLTTLIGPNNEGKSNLLRALVIAMSSLGSRTSTELGRLSPRVARRRRYGLGRYDWSNDCPVHLQKKATGASTITLEFELTATEVEEFRNEIGSAINGSLPISFTYGQLEEKLTINKPGKGNITFNKKSSEIARFVADRIEIQYIPAVRTANQTLVTVNRLVQRELSVIKNDQRYIQAINDIKALQKPILDSLSHNITDTMRYFLPNIKEATVSVEEQEIDFALSTISEVHINDGVNTRLEHKGDGVQSLAAIALMRHSAHDAKANKDTIVALEEPESHLHPAAIHGLRKIIQELSEKNQVILTTHNPIFANRLHPSQNVIVSKNRAYPADNINEVRRILGVQLSDNLASADIILIVEGDEDRIAFTKILESEPALAEAIRSGRLAIDVLGGAGNLNHRIRLHSSALCKHVRAFLDNDEAGQRAYQKAKEAGLLENSTVNFAAVPGKKESELEDLYKADVYDDILRQQCGLTLERNGQDKDRKWSDRVRNLLRRSGKPHDDVTVMAIKLFVSQSAAVRGAEALVPNLKGPVDSLVASLAVALTE